MTTNVYFTLTILQNVAYIIHFWLKRYKVNKNLVEKNSINLCANRVQLNSYSVDTTVIEPRTIAKNNEMYKTIETLKKRRQNVLIFNTSSEIRDDVLISVFTIIFSEQKLFFIAH